MTIVTQSCYAPKGGILRVGAPLIFFRFMFQTAKAYES
jgi:hypothetical protein